MTSMPKNSPLLSPRVHRRATPRPSSASTWLTARRRATRCYSKINQIGTISEAVDTASRAYELGWGAFISDRSGETTDDFITDLMVAPGAGHLKSRAPCRGERVAKYNQLIGVEDELRERGLEGKFGGKGFRFAWRAGME